MVSNFSQVKNHLQYLRDMNNGVNHRLIYTDAWNKAMTELDIWMQSRGMKTRQDALGNLFGKIDGESDKTVLLLSHYDSVENGGCYDGALGVIAGLAVIESLVEEYGKPRHSLELLAVCDEDGGRFKSSFIGSRAVSGRIDLEELEALSDKNGITFNEARKINRLDPLNQKLLKDCIRKDIHYAFELHVEQGRKLYDSGIPVGIVDTITGQHKIKATFSGEANHAGTTTMYSRKDALVAAAEMVCYVEKLAISSGDDAVGTVGSLEITPGATNIIPEKVTLIADLRCPRRDVLLEMAAQFKAKCHELATSRGLGLAIEGLLEQMPVHMNPNLSELMKKIALEQKIPFINMFSGAGHDIQIISSIAASALIFVQSEKGISHSPKEYTNEDSIIKGMEILKEAVYRVAYSDKFL